TFGVRGAAVLLAGSAREGAMGAFGRASPFRLQAGAGAIESRAGPARHPLRIARQGARRLRRRGAAGTVFSAEREPAGKWRGRVLRLPAERGARPDPAICGVLRPPSPEVSR